MRDRWSSEEAQAAIETWAAAWGEDLAARVYTSRLIGSDPALVLHGGGNTSVKSTVVDLLGETREVLHVKGSGWDLGRIEPQGFPAVELPWIRRLRSLDVLSDEDMVRAIRSQMLVPDAPTPSIETLLHAFLPHRFVDHSHADAIVALTHNADPERHIRRALGPDVAIVPYVKAGFDLAKIAADVHDAHPGCVGLVLLQHGLFTFGDTARLSYQRHIALVARAEAYLAEQAARVTLHPPTRGDTLDQARARVAHVAPMLRGALAEVREGRWCRWVLDWRCDKTILDFLSHPRMAELVSGGPSTPDHVIRTKKEPVVVTGVSDDIEATREAVEDAVRGFREAYDRYFVSCAGAAGGVDRYTRLDDTPRVALVPGVGLFGVGRTEQEASIAADIYQQTVHTKLAAAALGPWRGLSDQDLFDMEYWSLEQAKLKRSGAEPALVGQVAMITGGAGAIGIGIAKTLLGAGALVLLVDRDEEGVEHAARILRAGRRLATVVADVTDPGAVDAAFRAAAARWGGVDLVVANAGVAAAGDIAQLEAEAFRRVIDVNLTGTWVTLQAAARHFARQGTGGNIVLVGSKNVMDPGAGFSAYSASKAGAHQVAKIAALELARLGVRVNIVAPDAVFAEGDIPSRLWVEIGPERARARGQRLEELPAYYRDRNLLKAEITARHVGDAVLFFASERTPTTGATLPVDGGLPAAFPR